MRNLPHTKRRSEINKKKYVGSYGVLKDVPNKLKYIYLEDLEKSNENLGITILKCIEEKEEYIVVQSLGGKAKFRLKREIYEIKNKPKFNNGDKVRLFKYPVLEAKVSKICWHNKDKRIYYFLNVENDKRKSASRYYEDENKFEKI